MNGLMPFVFERESEKISGPEIIWIEKFCGQIIEKFPEKILVCIYLGPKTFLFKVSLILKNLWVWKKFGPNSIASRNFFSKICLGLKAGRKILGLILGEGGKGSIEGEV